MPIEGVAVYCELCGEDTHSWSFTDSSGAYSFTGVWTHGTRGHDTVHPGRKEPHQARGEYVCKAAVFGLRGQVGSHTQLAYPSNSLNGVRVFEPVRLMPSLACHLASHGRKREV